MRIGISLSNFKTNKVNDMAFMFQNCGSISKLEMSNWDTSENTDFYMILWYNINKGGDKLNEKFKIDIETKACT